MKCFNRGLQHNFKPRYDDIRNDTIVSESRGYSASDLKILMFDKIYVKDICIWCGKEINKRT